MKTIPYLLILMRFLSGIAILSLAYFVGDQARISILVLMYFGLLTDIFDGIIARKVGVSSEKLRRYDSQVDLFFWLCIGVSTYFLNPEIIKENWIYIVILLVLEASCYGISFLKFGKETCTHAFLAKMWGLTLLASFTSIIGFQYAGWIFGMCIVLGMLSYLDVILIILILPKWQFDIPSSYHAWQIRKRKTRKKTIFFN